MIALLTETRVAPDAMAAAEMPADFAFNVLTGRAELMAVRGRTGSAGRGKSESEWTTGPGGTKTRHVTSMDQLRAILPRQSKAASGKGV